MVEDIEHVIYISADALRADHLSCYGYGRETTPVIDRLADESLRFANAYSVSSHTREAVPAMLTGAYPDVAVDTKYRLATETIATPLTELGFATGGFHSNPFVSRAYGFGRDFDTFDDDLHLGQNRFVALAQRALDKLRNRHYARADEINERSLNWLDRVDEPAFLWNHYMDTHGPYEPPGEFRTLYADTNSSDRDAQSLYQRAIKQPDSIAESERQLLVDLYDGEIRYTDKQLEAFLDSLRERELLDSSLLVFTSDHGDAFGEHGYYEHPRYLHEEITRVPLLVRPPGGADGEVIKTPVSTLDIVPTIKQAVGAADQDESVSLLDPPRGSRTVYQQARGEDEDSHVRRYAARTRDGVCLCERDGRDESIVFTDCSDRSLRASLKRHVKARVRRQSGTAGDEDDDVDEEIERRLSALGYKE